MLTKSIPCILFDTLFSQITMIADGRSFGILLLDIWPMHSSCQEMMRLADSVSAISIMVHTGKDYFFFLQVLCCFLNILPISSQLAKCNLEIRSLGINKLTFCKQNDHTLWVSCFCLVLVDQASSTNASASGQQVLNRFQSK